MTTTRRPARSNVRHGMPTCARYGCQRPECARAYRRLRARQEMARNHGITGHVSAAAATRRVQQLQRAGVSTRDIADRTGISRSVIGKLAAGQKQRIYRTTHDAVLGIPVPRAAPTVTGTGYVDATGAMRRLRALSAIGYTRVAIGQRTGTSMRTIGDIRRGDQRRIRIPLDQAIRRVYDQLWDQDPTTQGVPVNTMHRMRLQAARFGWPKPADLDDDLIDWADEQAAA
jgi:hypothetical protein